MTQDHEKLVEPLPLDVVASSATAAIVENLEKYQKGERDYFEAYFYISYPLHSIEHDNFLATIGAEQSTEDPHLIITESGIKLYRHTWGHEDEQHCIYADESTFRSRFPTVEA